MIGPEEATLEQVKPTHEEEILKHFNRRIAGDAKDVCARYWERSAENHRFLRGGENQWDKEDWAERRKSKRPTFTMNDVKLAVNAFSGREITARFQQLVLPSEKTDQGWAEVLTEAIRQVRTRCFAEHVESDKIRDQAIEGVAVTDWRIDYLESSRGKIVVDGPDLWDYIWDPTAKRMCYVDREWDGLGRFLSLDEYVSWFPGDERADVLSELNNVVDPGFGVSPESNIARWPWLYRAGGGYYDRKRRQIFVVDYQWREREPLYLVEMAPLDEEVQALMQAAQEAKAAGMPAPSPPKSKRIEMSEEEFLAAKDYYAFEVRQGLRSMSPQTLPFVGPRDGLFRWKYRKAIIGGNRVISEEDIPERRFTRIVTTGMPFKAFEGTDYDGIVEDMKDPQRFKNHMISLGASYVARGPKMPLFYEPGAFEDSDEAIGRKLSTPFAAIRMKRGGITKFQAGSDIQMPTWLPQFMELADQATWRTLGMNPQTLGQVGDMRRITSGVMDSVQGAADVVLSYMKDSQRLARKLTGELILSMIAARWSRDDLADVVGAEKAQLIPPEQELEANNRARWRELLQRDVFIEEVPASKSERERMWEYFSRQGTIDKMVFAQMAPPQIMVEMIPEGWIEQRTRTRWMNWLDARFPDQPPPPAPPPGEEEEEEEQEEHPEEGATGGEPEQG